MKQCRLNYKFNTGNSAEPDTIDISYDHIGTCSVWINNNIYNTDAEYTVYPVEYVLWLEEQLEKLTK